MLAWISSVEGVAVPPWMAIDAHAPVDFEKARRCRPKTSGCAAISTSSPVAAWRNAASNARLKKEFISRGWAETPGKASFGGKTDQPLEPARSRMAIWYFDARSRARPDRLAVNTQRG